MLGWIFVVVGLGALSWALHDLDWKLPDKNLTQNQIIVHQTQEPYKFSKNEEDKSLPPEHVLNGRQNLFGF